MAGSTPASVSADAAPVHTPVSQSLWAEAWRRFKRHRLAYWSLWLLGALVLAVLLGPLFYKVGINDVDFTARLAPPSAKHWMGTDDLGRDILARVLYGGRISLAVGLAAMLMAITVGVLVGALAGMARGWVDTVLMWVTDLFLSMPQLPLLLLLIFLFRDPLKVAFGLEAGIFILIVLVIGGFRWMPVARLVRAQFFFAAREGVRGGGACVGRQHLAPGGPPHPAEQPGPGDRGRHHRHRGGHHRREHAELPRARLPARCADLGPHPLRWP
jgi:peptide/nickel transport system permease protein